MKEGVVCGLLSAVFMGFSVVVAAELSRTMSPLLVLFLCYLSSLPLLLLLAKATGKRLDWERAKEDMRGIVEIAMGRNVISALMVLFGFRLIPSVRVLFLLNLSPVAVSFLSSAMLKRSIELRQLLLVAATVLGASIIVTSGNLSALNEVSLGDLLVIGSTLLTAYVFVLAHGVGKRVDSITLTASSNAVAIPFLLLLLLIRAEPFMLTIRGAILVLSNTLLSFVLGRYFLFRSLSIVDPWVTSSLAALKLVAGSVLAYLWLGESPTLPDIVGGTIILFTASLVSRDVSKSPK